MIPAIYFGYVPASTRAGVAQLTVKSMHTAGTLSVSGYFYLGALIGIWVPNFRYQRLKFSLEFSWASALPDYCHDQKC